MTQSTGQSTPDLTRSEFDITKRGYDRQQVDDRLRMLASKLAAAERARHQEVQRASQAEAELRSALTKLKQLERQAAEGQNGQPQEGFGYRVEKVLRLAEQEAAEVRSKAAREASALVERARADAEAHRHDVEQSLIARAAKLDREASERQVELDERERQIHEQLAAAREEAEQVRLAAQREAEQLEQDALIKAEELRARAEQIVRQEREAADQELFRLRRLHDDVRDELGQLHEMLTAELSRAPGRPGHGSHAAASFDPLGAEARSEDKRDEQTLPVKPARP